MRFGNNTASFGVASALVFFTVVGLTPSVHAGAYIFAGEANGLDVITHPQGYFGTQTSLNVEVCISPSSNVPDNATSLNDVAQSIRNNIDIWNQLQPIVGNVLLGSNNDLGATEIDFESVALHELGHCIGLAHVNAASESGLGGSNQNYTKATNGMNNMFNINPGPDGVRGTFDDQRGDDDNLHWFRTDTNDPGALPLPVPVDAMTYDRDESMLPVGHDFAANLDRTVAGTLGHPNTSTVKTEAVMQQGTFSNEDQRRTSADGVATVLLAMSGFDETAGTADDYVINLSYGGISNASSCDISLAFEPSASVGLAFCSTTGNFIVGFGSDHVRIGSAFMRFGEDFNWFFNQNGPCRQSFDLTTGQWKQIALSCAPLSGSDTLGDLFGDDLSGTYDVDWVVYRRDAANDVYVKLALTDTLEVGRGYWIKTAQANQTINIEEDFNGDADFALQTDAVGRFNMVGHRYWYDQDWADVRVIDGASVLTLAQADPGGACQGLNPLANGCVMSRIAYKWNGSAYESFDGVTLGMEGALENFDGLWVKAFKSGISLRIPDQRSTPNAPHSETLVTSPAELIETASAETLVSSSASLVSSSASSAETTQQATSQFDRPHGRPEPQESWYIRLIAESGDLRDQTNVLGQLPDSVRGYDYHDLVELLPFGSDFLTIVFPHPKWKKAGDYTSDFHRLQRLRTRDRWHFEVRTSDTTGPVTLSWDGPAHKLTHSTLVDRETKERIDIVPGATHTFVMNGPSRRFTWVVNERKRSSQKK